MLPQLFGHLDVRFQPIQHKNATTISANDSLGRIAQEFAKLQHLHDEQETSANFTRQDSKLPASSVARLEDHHILSENEPRRLSHREPFQESDVGNAKQEDAKHLHTLEHVVEAHEQNAMI